MIRYDSKQRPMGAREMLRVLAMLLKPSKATAKTSVRESIFARWM